MGYRIDINKPQGERITELTLLKTEQIDPSKTYVVAMGRMRGQRDPQVWDLVENYIRRNGIVKVNLIICSSNRRYALFYWLEIDLNMTK